MKHKTLFVFVCNTTNSSVPRARVISIHTEPEKITEKARVLNQLIKLRLRSYNICNSWQDRRAVVQILSDELKKRDKGFSFSTPNMISWKYTVQEVPFL